MLTMIPETMDAAIYARYSTDKQRETSVEDQTRLCRAKAESLGLSVVLTHSDSGVSGTTKVATRRGGRALLADALAGRFQVLVLEGLDRLSRDQVEVETILRRLEFGNIRVVGVSDGYDSESGKSRKLLRGFRGMINEIYLDDLREKTHRGLAGQVERGFHAGGLSFGYRSLVAGVDAQGEAIGHRLEIDPAQAEWVRWIYARYVDGWSTKRIAHELNALGVKSARGGTWPASALHGRRDRGSGVLNNELYIGRYIWNRSQWAKDPDTGKRQRLDRPASEWQIVERADLRIVSDEVWQAAQARMHAPRQCGGGVGAGPKPRTLFGGLMRCGCCGGAVTAISSRLYGCTVRKERGPAVCRGVHATRLDVDRRLLSVAHTELLSPASLVQVQDEVRRVLAERRERAGMPDHVRLARLTELDRQIAHLVDAVAQAGLSPALQERLAAVEAQRDEVRQERRPATNRDFAPAKVLATYRELLMSLEAALEQDIPRAREALQQLFGEIRLVPEGDEVFAEVETRADRLLLAAMGTGVSNRGCGGRI